MKGRNVCEVHTNRNTAYYVGRLSQNAAAHTNRRTSCHCHIQSATTASGRAVSLHTVSYTTKCFLAKAVADPNNSRPWSSGLWRHAVLYVVIKVSEERVASWWSRWQVPTKATRITAWRHSPEHQHPTSLSDSEPQIPEQDGLSWIKSVWNT
jgi:hypothetical protein